MKNFSKRMAFILFSTLAIANSTTPESTTSQTQEYEKAARQILPSKSGILKFEKIIGSNKSETGFSQKQIFEIENDGKLYIFRKFSQKDSMKKRIKEIERAKAVSDAGVGPSFIGAPKNNEFYIVDFVGRAITYKDLTDETLKNIGKIIRKTHDFKFVKKGWSNQERLKKHYKKCIKKGLALPTDFHEACEDYITQNEESDVQIGFCHGNLKPNNIRINENGEITIINWKNAGNGDVFEDIGCFVLANGLNDEQIKNFLDGYLGKPVAPEDIDKVKNATYKACLLTAVIWFEFSENKQDKKIPIDKRVDSLNEMSLSREIMDIFDYPRKSQVPNLFSNDKEEIKKYAVSAWKKYEQTLVSKQGLFARFKKWIKSCF